MKTNLILLLLTSVLLLISACSNDSPVKVNEDPVNTDYVKVVTAESGGLKFEIWSSTAQKLRYAYNKVGFRVYENNVAKESGYVKFFPKMYHWLNSPMHSTPVKAQYNYDNALQMFTGYIVFSMVSDTSSLWYGFYNYNDQLYLDSAFFTVEQYTPGQIKAFSDYTAGAGYFLTLVKPYTPQRGFNTFQVMLHRTFDYINFEQEDNAQMIIMPWMESMLHGSTNNVNPTYKSEGIYEGTVNLTMPGEWTVSDTVYLENRRITRPIPPKFTLNP